MFKSLLILLILATPGWSTRYSQNFSIRYQHADRQVISDIVEQLESHYGQIAKELGADLDHRVEVYIHPDRHSLLKASGLESASRWLVGVAINDREIHLISPLNPPGNHSYESVMDGLIHELVHVCVANTTKRKLPLWFNEGLAVYYAKQYRFSQEVPGLVRDMLFLPDLNDLEDTESFERMHGYALSYTIVEFMLREYGGDRVRAFIRQYPDYNTLGIKSKMELENAWHAYLEENYVDPPALREWLDNRDDIFQATLSPNPVTDNSKLDFFAASDEVFTLQVLDPWGRRMQTLFQRPLKPGFHSFRISAAKFPAGYFYLLLIQGGSKQVIRFTR
ncbi:MAG: hypothetical protein J7L96_04945 [Bacteroidales bacterium]|nr:hypothetical protein [Bacteroidales bacterium]